MPHAILPDVEQKYNDWRDQLFQDGFAVVKNAISAERAAEYVEVSKKIAESVSTTDRYFI